MQRDFRAKLTNYIKYIIHSKPFIDKNKLDPRAFTRERKMPFPRLMLFLASFRNRSMQSELNAFLDSHDIDSKQSIDASALFKGRLKLAPSAFEQINAKSIELFLKEGDVKRWKGFELIVADGTTLRLPDNPDVAELFEPNHNAQGQRVGPPLARLNLLYDPLNSLCLSTDIDHTGVSEIEQFTQQDWQWKSNQLFIGDRHYDAFWLFAWLLQKECHFCIRMKLDSRPLVKEFVNSKLREQIVDFTPGQSAKTRCLAQQVSTQSIKLRLVRVDLPDGKVEVLATSVLDSPKISVEQFKELYHLRWPVEEKFKQLKYRVNLENWSGKSPLSVLQDIHARIWACNLTVLMAHPLKQEIQKSTAHRKYEYQINWANALACMKRWMFKLFLSRGIERSLEGLSRGFLSDLSSIRPNRSYPRNHKTYQREFYMCYKFCS